MAFEREAYAEDDLPDDHCYYLEKKENDRFLPK